MSRRDRMTTMSRRDRMTNMSRRNCITNMSRRDRAMNRSLGYRSTYTQRPLPLPSNGVSVSLVMVCFVLRLQRIARNGLLCLKTSAYRS